MNKYEIWSDNGVSELVVLIAEDTQCALDEYCQMAGYADHIDMCQQLGLEESPLNIRLTEKL